MSSPAATHSLWTSSTSSTQTDIQTPLSACSSPSDPNVALFSPRPRLPCPPWQRKISHSPDPTAPNAGGVPVPALPPAPLGEPREGGGDVGYVEDWGDVFCVHGSEG